MIASLDEMTAMPSELDIFPPGVPSNVATLNPGMQIQRAYFNRAQEELQQLMKEPR